MILLFTHNQDYYNIDLVADHLKSMGYDSVRINLDDFPVKWSISESLVGETTDTIIDVAGHHIIIKDVRAVWIRKLAYPIIDADLDRQYVEGCYREANELLQAFLKNLPTGIAVLDRVEDINRAHNKLYQLHQAKKAGMRVPDTLITNNGEDLKDFFNQQNGNIVMKMMTTLSATMEGSSFFLYTQKITEADLNDADLLHYCPLTFQEEIEKDHELRVAYVDGKCFIGKIDAKGSKKGATDWRVSEPGSVSWENGVLPADKQQKLRKFMNNINLKFGAIDYIVTPQGEYVFLEVNPIGEWGMLEKELGLPISKAIADYLVKNL